ncbi:phytanoyl-CoA dioxygenase family protein [Spirillospora sp. NPDC050679]
MAEGITEEQIAQLRGEGFTLVKSCVDPGTLEALRAEYLDAWNAVDAPEERLGLLRWPAFRRLLADTSVRAVPRSLFGGHLQLLDLWLTFQPAARRWRRTPGAVRTERDWHRDLSFLDASPARPLALNTLFFLDGTDGPAGATVVLPGSHRARRAAVGEHATAPHADEVAVPMDPGDLLVFNSHLVHSRGRNDAARPRRGVAMLWGFWFLKPVDSHLPLCPAATAGASEELLAVVGHRQPTVDQYLFEDF